MTSNHSPPQTPGPPAANKRRSSLADLFQPRSSSTANTTHGTPAFPSAMSTAMQQSRQNNPRRVSVSTSLGISGSPTSQSAAFGSLTRRRDSIASSQDTGSPGNEEAIMEDNDTTATNNSPTSPFARRVSFGAQAYGNVRSSRRTSNAEGFNWGDNLREKSGRPQPNTGSNSGRSASPPTAHQHQRAASIATVEPPKQMPAHPVHFAKPDVLGERMLRGDFMMD